MKPRGYTGRKLLLISWRLLKNSIPGREYLLFTEEYLNGYTIEDEIQMFPYTHNSENFGFIKTKFINQKND